jgi:hypothetical protein
LCEDIFERISDYDPEQHLQSITGRKCPETTEWILLEASYRGWKEEDSGYFWLTGKIGSGKTFITTAVIEDLSQVGFVGHYFFQPTETTRLQASDLFRSYILQSIAFLDARKIKYPTTIVASITHHFGPKASLPALYAIVKNIVIPLCEVMSTHNQKVFFVLDGLDACNQDEISVVLKTIRSIAQTADFHVFISARDEIKNRIEFTQAHNIHLAEQHTQNDIGTFIKWKMEEKKQFDDVLTTSEPLLSHISNVLNEKAHQMYVLQTYEYIFASRLTPGSGFYGLVYRLMLSGIAQVLLKTRYEKYWTTYRRILMRHTGGASVDSKGLWESRCCPMYTQR